MEDKILDVFYNHIIKEATIGHIDCYMYYNICFSTNVYETGEQYNCKINNKYLEIPTLEIKNKQLFDELLIKYVTLAKEFYQDDEYILKILDGVPYEEKSKICIEKILMTILWSNATFEDFSNPCNFIRRRIDFLNNDFNVDNKIDLGKSFYLNSDISIKFKKEKAALETPYSFQVIASDYESFMNLPTIRFGISDDIVYIYAIQSKHVEKNNFTKGINRRLFKVNENFDANKDNYETYGEGNLKDVTASFLVSAECFIWYLHSLGYNKFKVVSYLPERWNSKKIQNYYRFRNKEEKETLYRNALEEQNYIQQNLTQKFLRIFLRLIYHHPDISVSSYPFEVDESMQFDMSEATGKTNNPLFSEIVELSTKKNTKHL